MAVTQSDEATARPPPGGAGERGRKAAPGPARAARSAGLEKAQRRSDRQPQPMHESSPSRRATRPSICSSSRDRQAARQPGPVGLGRGAPVGQRGQRRGHLVEGEPDVAGRPDEGEPPQHAAPVAPLAAGGAAGVDQAHPLVVAQGRRGEAAPVGHLAHGEQVGGVHDALPRTQGLT